MVRKAVFNALLAVYREEGFLSDLLETWKQNARPSQRDFRLAFELGMGTIRRTYTLDAIAKELSSTGKLSLKLKEKVLVRMALYQVLFMDSMPLYAVADEMVKLAKTLCHPRFGQFLNALMHKLDGYTWTPSDDLSVHYSFDSAFVDELMRDYGRDQAIEVMECLNERHSPMMRLRNQKSDHPIYESKMGDCVTCQGRLQTIGKDPHVYIQNVTPLYLLDQLVKNLSKPPATILDLCAAPGGKLLALHDAFPNAELHANEVSLQRATILQENLDKYDMHAHVTHEDGRQFHSSKHFDLIILDVPCSNTGVMGKKPEARLRHHPEGLIQLQSELLTHCKRLLKKDGQVWYLTCSILKRENEGVIQRDDFAMIGEPITVLPNHEGWDGGFGCALTLARDK